MRAQRLPIILGIIALAGALAPAPSARAQNPLPPLRIGYLIAGSDLPQPLRLMEALRESLLSDAALANALAARGFGEIALRPCDGPADMEQRLRSGEFELAFATAYVYARLLRSATDLEPILQFRDLRGDIVLQDGEVFRKGAVFIGPASTLWNVAEPTPEQIRAELERARMAVPESYSEAGYIYPRIEIYRRFPGIRPQGPLFCRNSGMVVKHVVSGLASVGACEVTALEKIGKLEGLKIDKSYKELFRTTPPIPTSPVLVRGDLHPKNAADALGRELREAVQRFFNAPTTPAPGVRLERAERRYYEDMVRVLGELDKAEGPGGAR